MTPEQALQILSDALQPSMANQITRAGYIAIDQAIQTLAAAIKANAESSVEDFSQQSNSPTA